MRRAKHTHEIYREVGDEELTIRVRVTVEPGCRATRMEPGEPPSVWIESARTEEGAEVELTDEEVESLERGDAYAEILEALADAEEAAAEDAWEASRDR